MQDDALFIDLFSNQSSLIKRLARAFREAAREFVEDPAGYLTNAFKDYQAGNAKRRDRLRLGMAIGLFVYASLFVAMLVLWTLHARHNAAGTQTDMTIFHLSAIQPTEPTTTKSDKPDQGGGGGGNRELTPASQGVPPPFALEPPLIVPTTRPTVNPPVLPIPETLLGDPLQNARRNEAMPTGLLDGVVGPPSDGPGANGVGNGKHGGVGPGDGPGSGPGDGGGKNGGHYSPGGGRDSDPPTQVDTLPRALNEPRPNYTEEARAHKVQGVVRARILIGSDGLVKQVRILRGLPDGLSEEAIRAAMQMRFRPAMKGGAAVAFWLTLDVEFNLR
ncbi:MAG TPA: energy transducer TonB [Blastocatellia bacterium]|nr:energy transducer TonB [Blastocatellia bacterium]